jgi:predicted signal transduction protein with EAL and GGDEF domain
MQIDGYTVLISGILIRTLLAILFLAFWVKDRRAIWFGWWSAAFFLGDLAALAYLFGGFAVMFSPLGIMAAAVIAAIACFWQGARAFEGRAPLWLPVLGIPALWLLACLISGFLDDLSYRVALSSLVLALISAVIAFEFWRGRREKLPSRWAIIALFLSLSAFFASRIALVGIAPYPFGALPMQTSWLAVFGLVLILHTIILAVLIVAMSRERLEREQMLKAQTDLLTGALNRHAFEAYGERLISRHEQAGKPLCLLLVDLDQLKSLNDRFGHAGGDAILTALKALDPDDDGTIDLKEADAGALKVFKEINPDNDGTLDAKELEGRLTEAELKAADPDNDGTLDEKEYLAVVKKKFEAANPDNDGTVDLKELESPAGQELLKLIYK